MSKRRLFTPPFPAARLTCSLLRCSLVAGSLLAAALLDGCGDGGVDAPAAFPELLFERFTPVLAPDCPEEFQGRFAGKEQVFRPGVTRRVRLENSDRRSLVTVADVAWHAPLDAASAGAAFELTVAALGTPEESAPVTAVVEWIDGRGAPHPLLETAVESGKWRRESVALPAAEGELRLRSAGSTPVAWAELHLLPPRPLKLAPQDLPARPDLVLISIDTLRSDHVTTYGYERETTPNLDRLAAEGYLFTRSFSTSTWTLPSTATLLTGLLPSQHGLVSSRQRLPPGIDTLAERLRRQGYRAVAFTDGGFAGARWGFNQGFERYDVTPGEPWAPKDVAQIVAKARAWLAENRFHPYFLFLHTYEAHSPYVNAEGFADPFVDPAYRGRFRARARPNSRQQQGLAAADLEQIVALYDGEIRRADHYLGTLLDDLRATAWERTGVVVTSDHGEEFLEHGELEHGFGRVFDENVRVPLIVKPPAAVSPTGSVTVSGRRFTETTTGLDVAPTLLAMAGVPAADLPGRSLTEPPLTSPAADGVGAERALLIHGTNSFPELDEERFRIDQRLLTVIFDRVRAQAQWYDRLADQELRTPHEQVFDARAAPVAERLTAVLAWLEEAPLMVRLPAGCARVVAPLRSKVAPVVAWSGLERRWPVEGEDGDPLIELAADRSSYLLFIPRRERLPWRLEVQGVGEEPTELTLALPRGRREAAAWDPFVEPLPEPGRVLPTATSFQPGTLELDAETAAELRSLGYL